MPGEVLPEKVAAPPAKQDPITEEEEGDATTVESAAEEPVAEGENADPVMEEEAAPVTETKEIAATEDQKSEKQSSFACCEGDVLKNLQAAIGCA